MNARWPCLAAAVAVLGGLVGFAASAGAETCTLEIKRLETIRPEGIVGGVPDDYLYRSVGSQSFSMQVGTGKSRISFPGMKEREEAFKKLVKKEPQYQSETPLRGIFRLGSQEYAFALDACA